MSVVIIIVQPSLLILINGVLPIVCKMTNCGEPRLLQTYEQK